jgi:hypothetical protein
LRAKRNLGRIVLPIRLPFEYSDPSAKSPRHSRTWIREPSVQFLDTLFQVWIVPKIGCATETLQRACATRQDLQ